MKMSRGRIVAMVIGSIILLPIAFVVIGFWPGSTKDIEAVANQFQPGDGWQLESEVIRPPRLICLQADCGEMTRTWKLEKNITTEEFMAVLKKSGWDDMASNDTTCRTRSNVTSSTGQTMCDASGSRDDYRIKIAARGNHADDINARVDIWVHSRE